MVVAHIGANGLFLETDRWGGTPGERTTGKDLDSSQRVRDHLVVFHLVPAIPDFILAKNLECYNNNLEQTLMLLHSE